MMFWSALPRRSYRSINQRNRREASAKRAVSPVARIAVSQALHRSEHLEQRRLLATYTGTANADTFLIQIGGGNVTVTINGAPNIQSDAAVTDIVINALGGNDTITLINNTNNPTTINAGDGDDTITIGGGDYDTNISSNITITDGTGTADALIVDDTADGIGSDTYNLTVDRTLSKTGSATTTWNAINSVVVNGSAQVNTWNVNTDNASGTVTLNGGAAVDTFNIGDATLDLGNNIDNTLFVNGSGGADVVTMDDTAEPSAVIYTLDANGLTSNQIGAAFRIGFLSISSGTLNAAAGNISHTFNILDLNGIASATINAGDGPDTLNYGDGVADINAIDVAITFNGQAGTDTLNYNSQTTVVNAAKTVTSTTIDSTQHGVLTHGTMEALVMNLSTASETLTFNSTPLTALTTVNAGDGDDTINIGAGDFVGTVDENVTINGGLGVDSLLIDDSTNTTARTWGLTGNSASASTDSVTWSTNTTNNVDHVSLLGGTGADTFTKTASNSNASMTVNGGGGNDSLFAGTSAGLSNWPGMVVFQGAGGIDLLDISDTGANTTAQTYTLTSDATTLVTRTGAAGAMGFNSTTDNVELRVGSGGASALAQIINVNQVAAGTLLVIHAGDGADTINISGGDWGQNIDRTVSVNGGAGNDRININDSANPDSDTYTHTAGVMTSADASLAQVLWDANVVLIDLTGSAFADTFIVGGMRTTDNITMRGGAGNDSLTSATNPDDMDNTFVGNFDFFGDADVDSITLVDAEGADGPENYNVSGSTFEKSAATFGDLDFTTVEDLNFTLDDDASLVTLGVFFDGQSVSINAGLGNDTIQNDLANDIATRWEDVLITLSGGAGTDVLDLDDTDSGATSYGIDSNFISTLAFGVNGPSNVYYDIFETITILTSSVSSNINVIGVDGTTNFTLNAGDGADFINIGGNAGSDLNDSAGFSLVTGVISLLGGLGTDSLSFRDTDNEVGDDVYQLNQTSFVVGLGGATPITFSYNSDVDRMLVQGSDLANRYDIESTFSSISTTLTGGTANDRFNIAPTLDDIDLVDALITINGGSGVDTVQLHDTANAIASTWSVSATFIDRTGFFGGISPNGVESIDLDAGTAVDTFNVTGSASGAVYNLDGRGDNDVFNISSSGNMDFVDGIITLLGGAGSDLVNYNDASNAAVTTYTIGTPTTQTIGRTGAANVVVGVDNELVTVTTGSAANTININAWSALFVNGLSVVAGAGNDTITVGNGDFDSNIGSNLTINSGNGLDSVVLNDSTDNDAGDTYTLTSSTILDSGNSATVSLFYNDSANTEAVVLNLPGGAELVNVLSSISGISMINGGDGNDTVNAGNGDLDLLNGTLIVDGGLGSDRFNLDNSTDLAAGTNRIDIAAISPTLGQLSNIDQTPTDITQWTNATERVVVTDSAANTTFNVNSLPAPGSVSILGGDGNDTVNAGGGDIDLNLAAGINVPSFSGGNGTDVLNLDDSADNAGNDVMSIQSVVITKGGQDVSYFLFEALNITGSPQATTYNVGSVAATTPVNISAGGAADTFNVGGNDLDANILASVTLGGGGGTDAVNYNDTADAADPDTYTINAGDLFTKSSFGAGVVIDANAVESTTLNANNGSNPIDINTAPSNLTINANGGDDDVSVFDGGTSAAPVIFSSGAGNDTIEVDNDADAIDAFVRFAATDEVARMVVGTGSTLQNAPGNNSTMIVTTSVGLNGAIDVASGFFIARVGVLNLLTWTNRVTAGYAAGAWNGAVTAVNTSAAAGTARGDGVGIRLGTDPNAGTVLTFGGQSVNPGDVLMGYMQNGDTDMDRDIDFSDLLRLAQNYGLPSPRAWTQGNSDYDPDVDFSDLLTLAQNYGLPFLTASTHTTDFASASSALSDATKRRGVSSSVSRALKSIVDEANVRSVSGGASFGDTRVA